MPAPYDRATVAVASRYVAYGTVGAIEAWLEGPEPRSVDAFAERYRLLLPAWWPLA